jgi:hypothetical protein
MVVFGLLGDDFGFQDRGLGRFGMTEAEGTQGKAEQSGDGAWCE